MTQRQHHPMPTDMVGIAREASLYDWLIARSRTARRPQLVPQRLHADLGLVPPHRQSDWSGWRPFG